jgi:hypothetical protein
VAKHSDGSDDPRHLPVRRLTFHSATMASSEGKSAERRWVVIAEDGRHVTLGRASDPTETEIREAEQALRAQGLAGWLAVMEGNPYAGVTPRLLEVRMLGVPNTSFKDAAANCIAAIMAHRKRTGG